ncbi:hypothetical protein VX037_23015 [Gordonia sp. Z-3]|uniref:Uncharacterized protein n=1 Tax=Gordonia tangerina TaxID=2911060 RepID=A0ABS9DDJ6_9ACTN|nr:MULTISPECIES: hypothetical protein [Gordonia]MAU80284.1 hypothetical protein [Gordonia sp. (in: high G+C Gram-positive bacteria)]MCF3937287.1 hypothetical protein [Gordonia tangerina]MED5803902.1 hypothetical protein [Gordonia sp. Z-3]
MEDADERRQIGEVQERLIAAYSDRPSQTVAAAVEAAYRHFDGIRVRDFVPLLVERRANASLNGNGSAPMADSHLAPPHHED